MATMKIVKKYNIKQNNDPRRQHLKIEASTKHTRVVMFMPLAAVSIIEFFNVFVDIVVF